MDKFLGNLQLFNRLLVEKSVLWNMMACNLIEGHWNFGGFFTNIHGVTLNKIMVFISITVKAIDLTSSNPVRYKFLPHITSSIYRVHEKCTAQTTEDESTQQYEKKYYMNTLLLQRGFRATSSWRLKKMFTLNLHADIEGDRLPGAYFLPSSLTGMFTKCSCGTSRAPGRC